MKKINALFTLIMVATMILTGCTLPARGTPPPTGDTSGSAVPPTATSVSIPAQSTDTGVLPTAAPLPAITYTPVPGAAYPEPATPVPAIPSATPLPAASRILFTSGATSTTVEGDLDAGQTLYYVIEGAAGQSMDVDLSSPTSNVYLGVTAATTGGTLLDALLQDANWTGTLPAAQDYYLSVTASGAETNYSLTVALSPLSTAPIATATTVPPVVNVPFDPVAQYGRPDFEDPMTGSSISDWEDEDGDLPDTLYIRLALTDARFYVTGKLAGFSTWYFTWRELSDFYLQATMDSGTCSGQDAYGLIVRGPAHMAGVSYGYVVAFTCDGKVWVFRLDDADPFTIHDLVSLTPSTHINSGPNQRNLIGIQAVGDTLTIYANGHQVAQVVDDHYDFGRIGVFVSPQWTPFYTYRVVNYSLWDLGE
jgi:hypothetical protein